MILMPHLRPVGDQGVSSARRKYEVTIYSWTDCKLYDLVHEGVVGAPRTYVAGIAAERGEGDWDEGFE